MSGIPQPDKCQRPIKLTSEEWNKWTHITLLASEGSHPIYPFYYRPGRAIWKLLPNTEKACRALRTGRIRFRSLPDRVLISFEKERDFVMFKLKCY